MDDENDPTISDDTVLWRRVTPNLLVDDGNGGRRVSSRAFQNASQEYHNKKMAPHGYNHNPAMSTNFASKTTIKELLKVDSNNFIVSFTVGFVRKLNQGVLSTPLPDDCAHASVTGKKSKRIKKELAKGCVWVKEP